MDTYLYFSPILVFWAIYIYVRHRRQKFSALTRKDSIDSGLTEPASLHPVIDRNKCIGCRSCIYACPQQLGHNVLGIFHGKAELLEPTNCIGHGACKKVCPEGAITLVFGTEQRGVDIPQVNDKFETNVKGIYIAGELGGMGLIRNAIEQGKCAIKTLSDSLSNMSNNPYQVIIVGAGPAGIAATLAAEQKKLKYLTLDQDSLGGTVFQYPRGKVVMTQPVELPLAGKMPFKETSKEDLLDYWQGVEKRTGIKINYQEIVGNVENTGKGFAVKTNRGVYLADKVLLTMGRRGTPRKLGIPGENLPKVMYRLIDPAQYLNQKVLIVGGGDSALEAALAIADVAGSEVSLSYRSESFARAKAKNRDRLEQYSRKGKINLYLPSTLTRIDTSTITLNYQNENISLPNDAVIINAGGILPNSFLKQMGIQVDTKFGTV